MLEFATALQWRHNVRYGVPDPQPHDCLLNCLFRRRSKKTSKFCVTGLCAGNSPVTDEFPAQGASNAENVSIWWRHHGMCLLTLFRIEMDNLMPLLIISLQLLFGSTSAEVFNKSSAIYFANNFRTSYFTRTSHRPKEKPGPEIPRSDQILYTFRRMKMGSSITDVSVVPHVGQQQICERVCSFCAAVARRSVSALCHRHCSVDGSAFKVCLTIFTIRDEFTEFG